MILRVEGPLGSRDLSRSDLEAIAGPEREGCSEVRFAALESLLDPSPDVTHATFHAADGYAASIPVEQARADGLVLVPRDDSKTGVRLIVSEGSTTCLNVKAVTRVELSVGQGRHTVDPNPHTPARVRGWDD